MTQVVTRRSQAATQADRRVGGQASATRLLETLLNEYLVVEHGRVITPADRTKRLKR
ncbi:hypothetical protein [Qipengyuania flava]|uniref:hypothetical protein n=1 Tax=Qipengyuania flava TaxID=192812 RepID=UPI0012FDC2E8|nr:hypothetical protein [Qipengyuania flava]